MEVDEQIRLFREFIEQNYYPQLLEAVRKGQAFLSIDFRELIKFNTELAEETTENPVELLKAAELAVKEFDLPQKLSKFTVRLKNLTESLKVQVNEIRSKHLNKLMWVEGIVRQKSDVRPHVTAAKFECPSCGNILNVLQLDKKYKEPSRCSCGRKGKFKEISKELVDGQGLVLEEAPDELDGSQAKRINVFLKDDLVSPISERKSSPGSRVRITGWVIEVPVILQRGGQATKYDLVIEANYSEPTQDEDIDRQISDEEMEKIKEIASQPNVSNILANSLAPSIYGHDKIKEALVLQLAGGCRKVRPDGMTTRGDMHILLIGDPGCIVGDSQVALYAKGMKPIQSLGEKHLQPLREAVTVIRKNQHASPYQYTSNFQIYPQQMTLRLVTETGKELICTYNHPLLTKQGWQRADALQLGKGIRVMPKIPNYIRGYKKTNFKGIKKSSGKLKENVRFPGKVTPHLASLFGYIIGDGHVHKDGYRVICYVNQEESDLLPVLQSLWKENFNIIGSLRTASPSKEKTIREKGGLRKVAATQPLHILQVNSKAVTYNLNFLAEKRVPQVIFESPLDVVSAFLRWLFEADGSTFHTGRGKTSVQLKSVSLKLLRDVQLLLLYFGIQSRIIGDNLCVRRSQDLRLFAQKIGFVSQKKKKRLDHTIAGVAQKSDQQKRKTPQRYEKIVSKEPYKIMDVYDLEVPRGHLFIANGFVSHNSAKSQLLKCIAKVAPKARFTSGKGATAAGLCVAPDSLVLANPDLHVIEELVEKKIDNNATVHCPGVWKAKDSTNNHKVLALDEQFQIKPAAVSQFWKIKAPEQMREVHTRSGKKITLTPNTALLTLQAGDPCWKKSKQFREGDFIATARRTVSESDAQVITVSLLKSNPIVYGVKKVVAEMINELLKKNKSKRALAKTLSWSENNLYHHWVKEKARGNITLRDFKKLVAASGYPLEKAAQEISGLSLYRGHRIKVPLYLNGKLLYFAGLMAGDGDLSQGKNSVVIRFSNLSEELLHQFKQLAQELFGVPCNVSSIKSAQRPGSLRFGSKLVYEILSELGLPSSPKSHRIDISSTLWRLPNDLVKEYIKGLFDTDGSVVERKRGASYLDFSTTSEQLAIKMPLLLLRFGILAKVRPRKMGSTSRLKNGKFITPRHGKFALEIKGKENLELFKANIDFGYSGKRIKLSRIIGNISKYDTNIDTIPTIQEKIKKIKRQYHLTSRQIFNYKRSSYDLAQRNFSRRHILAILQRMKSSGVPEQNPDFLSMKNLAQSDLFWDKIVQIKNVKPGYEYVYDLTMPNSQNFLVNGFIVHNTASVVKDEFLGGWSLEAGTLVLANRGFALIDEMDKMGKDDRSALHEAMEQQQVSISKANIQATLRCETTIIAAANPKFGRFDPYGLVAEQIDLPPTLINRFDLIFPIKDLPNRERDEQMASFILKLHQNPEQAVAEIPPDLLRKYFSYIRQKVNPKMTDAAIDELKEYYINMRNSGIADEGGRKSIPITARQLEALVRLSEAAAKIRLAKTVSKKDAQKAIELVDYCLNQVAMDPQTGKIDIDRLGGTITATQRSGISVIKEIISALEEQLGSKVLPMEAIVEAALNKNIPKDQAEQILEKLRRSGDIFEPKRGFVQKL